MENEVSADETSKGSSSRDNSVKDLTSIQSRTSIKSVKSLESCHKSFHSASNTGTLKSEKDVHFTKASVKIKGDKHPEGDQIKGGSEASLKVPHKIISNWKQACDRTRDRTRDLLKRWRTLPEFDPAHVGPSKSNGNNLEKNDCQVDSGWSVHVWTTWVDRFSVDTSETWEHDDGYQLTPTQSNKFSLFFTMLLDHDQDDLISEPDFEALIERFRHFADWSTNSPEYNILREVERGFMETFLQGNIDEKLGFEVNNQIFITLEGWLHKWVQMVSASRNLSDFPIWLQYFVKVLFQVINRSGSGIITRDELSAFYSSVLLIDTVKVGEIIDVAYQAMTSNGDHPLGYRAYRLCFANYLLGRYPNGPGQFIFGAGPTPFSSALFPVDYSALNALPEDLEQYVPDHKTNRRSVIV